MPRAAVDAAIDTFALVMRERHPGVIALPLRNVGADGSAVSPPSGQVIKPFAAPENRHPVLDWNAGAIPLHDDRVDRAAEDALAVTDR
jgi:hypothetical protein